MAGHNVFWLDPRELKLHQSTQLDELSRSRMVPGASSALNVRSEAYGLPQAKKLHNSRFFYFYTEITKLWGAGLVLISDHFAKIGNGNAFYIILMEQSFFFLRASLFLAFTVYIHYSTSRETVIPQISDGSESNTTWHLDHRLSTRFAFRNASRGRRFPKLKP